MKILDVKNLNLSYEGRDIFKNLSFSVSRGDYLCVVGENGSGKTSLMHCLLGLNKNYSGSIEFNCTGKNAIGWLPQKNESKRDFPAGAFEVVLSGFAGKSFFGIFYSNLQKQKALENMRLLEIEDIKNKPFSLLSGGQQQRVLLCRALCAAESLLLLDEPASGLDSIALDELYSAVNTLNKNGMTIIMISHDIKRATLEANKILQIENNGYFFGSCEEYLKRQG